MEHLLLASHLWALYLVKILALHSRTAAQVFVPVRNILDHLPVWKCPNVLKSTLSCRATVCDSKEILVNVGFNQMLECCRGERLLGNSLTWRRINGVFVAENGFLAVPKRKKKPFVFISLLSLSQPEVTSGTFTPQRLADYCHIYCTMNHLGALVLHQCLINRHKLHFHEAYYLSKITIRGKGV